MNYPKHSHKKRAYKEVAVHVMPDDGKHIASEECHCGPTEDEQVRRARAQGRSLDRVFVHKQLN
jgi:hypothetical protein